MIVLFDLDACIYQSCYRICEISDIRGWISDNKSRDWMEAEIVSLSVNRLNNMIFNIYESIEETGIEITDIEYYITTCKNSMRRKYYAEYKANRSINPSRISKWVSKSRKYIKNEMNFAIGDDEWEADDLIADRAKEIGIDKIIVLSVDKDLKAIGGLFFDYYKIPLLDDNNVAVVNEYGRPEKVYRGLSSHTELEARRFHFIQLIMGDQGDNIKGANGFGEKKAIEIIDNVESEEYEIAALNAYYEAELRIIKKHLNSCDSSFKKMTFKKFTEAVDNEEIDIGSDNIKGHAKYNYTLNKFLIELGTKRDSETYKILNK